MIIDMATLAGLAITLATMLIVALVSVR